MRRTALCQHVELQGERKAAGQKEGRGAQCKRCRRGFPAGKFMHAVLQCIRQAKRMRQRWQQAQHLQADRQHHEARDNGHNCAHLRREHQCGAGQPDHGAEARITGDPAGIEAEMRDQALCGTAACRRLVVFGGERQKEPTGDGHAGRYGRDQADNEDKPQRHVLADIDPRRQMYETARHPRGSENENDCGQSLDAPAQRACRRHFLSEPRAVTFFSQRGVSVPQTEALIRP